MIISRMIQDFLEVFFSRFLFLFLMELLCIRLSFLISKGFVCETSEEIKKYIQSEMFRKALKFLMS